MAIKHNADIVNCSVLKKSSPPICTGMRRQAPVTVGRNFRLQQVSALSCDWPLQHYEWTLIGKANRIT